MLEVKETIEYVELLGITAFSISLAFFLMVVATYEHYRASIWARSARKRSDECAESTIERVKADLSLALKGYDRSSHPGERKIWWAYFRDATFRRMFDQKAPLETIICELIREKEALLRDLGESDREGRMTELNGTSLERVSHRARWSFRRNKEPDTSSTTDSVTDSLEGSTLKLDASGERAEN